MPGRMPVVAAGTVHRVAPASQTTFALGPSSTYPSVETQSTSSTRLRTAQRRAARVHPVRGGLHADRKPVQLGAGAGGHPEGEGGHGHPVPPGPLRRRRDLAEGGADGRRPAALRPPGADQPQRPLHLGRPARPDRVEQVDQEAVGRQRQLDRRRAGRSRARWASSSQGRPPRRCIVSKSPSPCRAPSSSPRSTGSPAGTTPRPSTATRDATTSAEHHESAYDDRRPAERGGRTMIGRCPNPPSRNCSAPVGCG